MLIRLQRISSRIFFSSSWSLWNNSFPSQRGFGTPMRLFVLLEQNWYFWSSAAVIAKVTVEEWWPGKLCFHSFFFFLKIVSPAARMDLYVPTMRVACINPKLPCPAQDRKQYLITSWSLLSVLMREISVHGFPTVTAHYSRFQSYTCLKSDVFSDWTFFHCCLLLKEKR